MTTRLEFEGKIVGAKLTIAKGNGDTGGLELTFRVEAPKLPAAPSISYEFATTYGRDAQWKPRPEDLKRKKGPGKGELESEEEYSAREDVVRRRRDQEAYDRARSQYDAGMERYQRQLREHGARLRTYALIPGVAALFGNEAITIALTPANQDILPGFELHLLPEAPLEDPDEEEDTDTGGFEASDEEEE